MIGKSCLGTPPKGAELQATICNRREGNYWHAYRGDGSMHMQARENHQYTQK